MCGVSVGGNPQIRLSTFFFFSLWMFVFGLNLFDWFMMQQTEQHAARQIHRHPCLPCWFVQHSILPSSSQFSALSKCVCVCVCVCPYLLCKLILYLPHLKSWADKPAWQWEKKRNMSLPCPRANNKWSFVLLCKCTTQRHIQWKQLLTSLNNHFNFSETTLFFNMDDWLTASVKSRLQPYYYFYPV